MQTEEEFKAGFAAMASNQSMKLMWKAQSDYFQYSWAFHLMFKNKMRARNWATHTPIDFRVCDGDTYREYSLLLDKQIQKRNSLCDSKCPAEHLNSPVPHLRELVIVPMSDNDIAEYEAYVQNIEAVAAKINERCVLPEHVISRVIEFRSDFDKCPICLDTLSELDAAGQKLAFSANCCHLMCHSCIIGHVSSFVYSNATCPICRESFTKEDVYMYDVIVKK